MRRAARTVVSIALRARCEIVSLHAIVVECRLLLLSGTAMVQLDGPQRSLPLLLIDQRRSLILAGKLQPSIRVRVMRMLLL